jgi:iodothyronine deiodinase-like protein
MKSNVAEDICYPQPTTLKQRVAIANDFVTRFHFPLPIAIDPMNNSADRTYGGWPERIYIVDESGKVVYRGGLGPFNYHPSEAREWLAKRFPQATSVAAAQSSGQ